ncbi:unnamed protein product [Prorocentrum cordatum]|uniref:Uncharacterized protein n=1 Tax=Prorocentrum cordatum TaxID=2364126 RepID=A0ABN9PPI2_9DINO|nr:unnamed protein product [Polarella glacialis]
MPFGLQETFKRPPHLPSSLWPEGPDTNACDHAGIPDPVPTAPERGRPPHGHEARGNSSTRGVCVIPQALHCSDQRGKCAGLCAAFTCRCSPPPLAGDPSAAAPPSEEDDADGGGWIRTKRTGKKHLKDKKEMPTTRWSKRRCAARRLGGARRSGDCPRLRGSAAAARGPLPQERAAAAGARASLR